MPKRLTRRIGEVFIALSARFNRPGLAAYIFFKATHVVKSNNENQRVLYFAKSVFDDDMGVLIDNSDEFDFIRFPRLFLSIVCRQFIPFFDELDDASYHPRTKDHEGVGRLRTFLRAFIEAYKRRVDFDLVICGSFVYKQQQEIVYVLEEMDIPVFVLYREGILPLEALGHRIKVYSTKVFRGTKLLCYNEKLEEALIKAEIPGLVPEKLAVVGVPRFDAYFQTTKEEDDQYSIGLFSFEPQWKSKFFLDDQKRYAEFAEKTISFHKMFADFILRHNNYKLVVKTKSNDGAFSFAQNVYKVYQQQLGDRLIITQDIPAQEVILRSGVVAAYSSTTLIEGLILGRILICPDLSSIISEKSWDMLYPYNHLARYISTFDQLEEAIIGGMRRDDAFYNARQEYLEKMIYRVDGQSCKRVEVELLKVLR